MNKNILAISVIVLLIVGGLGFAFGRVTAPVKEVAKTSETKVLGVDPNIASQYFSVGGVLEWKFRTDTLQQATTTVCVFPVPAATSTLNRFTFNESISSTTASIIDIGLSTNPTATTTLLNVSTSVAANGMVNIALSSSTITVPGQFVVVNQKAGPGLIANPTGVCQASFQQITY